MSIFSNKKFLWLLIIILLVLNIISVGSIWLTRERHPIVTRDTRIRGHRQGNFLSQKLNFSPEQQAEFDSLLSSHRARIDSTYQEIRTLREQLMEMMENNKYNEQAAENIARQIADKQADVELLNYRHFRDVLNICNDVQKESFIDFVKDAVGPHRGPMDHNNRGRWHRRGGQQ